VWRVVEWFLDRTDRKRRRIRIERALALNRRGEARADGLDMTSLCSRLEIEWRARDVHPWDRSQTPERYAATFVEQCLSDTDAAIIRLFEGLPWVDILDVRVLDPNTDETIISGTVYRPEAQEAAEPALGMRLKNLGVTYRVSGWHFESLKPEAGDKLDVPTAAANSHGRPSAQVIDLPLRSAARRG